MKTYKIQQITTNGKQYMILFTWMELGVISRFRGIYSLSFMGQEDWTKSMLRNGWWDVTHDIERLRQLVRIFHYLGYKFSPNTLELHIETQYGTF